MRKGGNVLIAFIAVHASHLIEDLGEIGYQNRNSLLQQRIGNAGGNKGFPGTDLVYDKQEKAIFNYTICNADYSNKKQVSFFSKPKNQEIPVSLSLEASDLTEAYEKGQLKGRLKEIAATLDEEANPVIMLIKHKK